MKEREEKEKHVYRNVKAFDAKLFLLLSLSIFVVVVDDNIGRVFVDGK